MTLIRDGVSSFLNPFDRRTLALATTLRDQDGGGQAVAITMGPPQAEEALRGALSVGADRAVHLCDAVLAGADTLATARALAAFIAPRGFDLVLCGQYSIDAETGQVGAEVAALLDLPHVTAVTALEMKDGCLMVTRETDAGSDTFELELPAVITVAERVIKPAPHPRDDMLAQVSHLPVERVSLQDLGLAAGAVGLAGSPTVVAGVRPFRIERQPVIRDASDPAAACDWLVAELNRAGAFAPREQTRLEALPPAVTSPRTDRQIMVVAEFAGGHPRLVTRELLAEAVRLAGQVRGTVSALAIGSGVEPQAAALAADGAETVYLADSPELGDYSGERYAWALRQAIESYQPWAVLAPATSFGRDFTPRAAAQLGLGVTADAVAIEIDADGQMAPLKPAFGGLIVASILSRTVPHVATVRPGMLAPFESDHTRRAEIVRMSLNGLPQSRTRLVDSQHIMDDQGDLDSADRIVCAGFGLQRPEELLLVKQLAEALGAKVGGTRRVTDAGWLPRQLQIGLTGKPVSPALYVAVAVHGAIYHTVGITRAGTVVAMNNDPTAPIFQHADYGLVGDYRALVPALVDTLKRAGVTSALVPASRTIAA